MQDAKVKPASEAQFGTWLPIETAPKDGSYVLLYYPSYPKKVWVGRYYNVDTYKFGVLEHNSQGWATGEDSTFFAVLREKSNPTHWMPTPPLPK